MGRSAEKIAFVIEDFAVPSAAQHLLDRVLMGYPRDGEFHQLDGWQVAAWLSGNDDQGELGRRTQDFGLVRAPGLDEVLAEATAVVLCREGAGAVANDALLTRTLEKAQSNSACFVYGPLASTFARARLAANLAAARGVRLLSGTAAAFCWRLPEVELRQSISLRDALIVVEGPSPAAELEALEAMLPFIERRRGGEAGIHSVRFLDGPQIWEMAGRKESWWPLLAAAISRSNNPQGDPVRDGRTQDIIGLGLAPSLARDPRGWLIEHRDGLRSTILVLDGVVTDYSVALRTGDHEIISAQLFRGPMPAQHHFSRLASAVEDFFRLQKRPWPIERNLVGAGLLAIFQNPAAGAGKPVKTPHLNFSYSVGPDSGFDH